LSLTIPLPSPLRGAFYCSTWIIAGVVSVQTCQHIHTHVPSLPNPTGPQQWVSQTSWFTNASAASTMRPGTGSWRTQWQQRTQTSQHSSSSTTSSSGTAGTRIGSRTAAAASSSRPANRGWLLTRTTGEGPVTPFVTLSITQLPPARSRKTVNQPQFHAPGRLCPPSTRTYPHTSPPRTLQPPQISPLSFLAAPPPRPQTPPPPFKTKG